MAYLIAYTYADNLAHHNIIIEITEAQAAEVAAVLQKASAEGLILSSYTVDTTDPSFEYFMGHWNLKHEVEKVVARG